MTPRDLTVTSRERQRLVRDLQAAADHLMADTGDEHLAAAIDRARELVAAGDPDHLVDRIVGVLEDRELYRRKTKTGGRTEYHRVDARRLAHRIRDALGG